MLYREQVKDLFSVSEDYYFAQCISADFAMGKGIAVEFNKRFDIKRKLKKKYLGYLEQHNEIESCPSLADCILEGRVFNLVTKTRYWKKPSYKSLSFALLKMKEMILREKIEKVAMPVIGCGLDGLQWEQVSEKIKEIFASTELEILVCKQKEEEKGKKKWEDQKEKNSRMDSGK